MATEDLKRFLIERLLDLDETLSDDEGSIMFTKVIDPTIKRLGTDPMSTDIETFILERLQDEFPNLDVNSPGSTLRDVLVSPLVILLEPLRREIHHLRQQLSLSDVDALDSAEMDALLSNWFTTRDIGAFADAVVRVYFSAPRAVSLDSSITFSTGSGIAFVPSSPRTYLPSDMKRSGNLYFIDVSVISLQATVEANVSAGAIKFVNGLDGVVRVTNQAAASGGLTEETNEDFLTRAERSLSERSLNTKRGIETNIYNNFSDIVSIEVVGFGEADMQRDIIQAETAVTVEESVGPLVYTTSEFRTLAVIDAGDGTEFPFTHTFRMYNVPTSKQAAIENAEYIRVVDGNNYFDGTLLSRVREVESVTIESTPDIPVANTVDIVIRTKDFEIYPPQASVTSTSSAATIITNEDEMGFNRFSRRGSEWIMYANDSGTDKITGAPLPFTDYVNASGISGNPTSVLPGRDFLVTITEDAKWLPTGFATKYLSNKIRLFPLDSYYTGNRLGVSRVDSFLDSKQRVTYPGAADYEFSSKLSTSGAVETLEILDYGAPSMTETWTPATNPPVITRYDGTTKDSFGRNAGVAIRAFEPGTTTVANYAITSNAKDVQVTLNPATADWLSRGVAPGDFICVAVYEDIDIPGIGFDQTLANANDNLSWSGWGVISSISTATPHVATVVGIDTTELHNYGKTPDMAFGGFSSNTAADAGRFQNTTKIVNPATYTANETPDGAVTVFTFNLTEAPGAGVDPLHPGIIPGSITIQDTTNTNNYTDVDSGDGTGTFNDGGSGDLASGTINYTTGLITLTYAVGREPAGGATWSGAYSYYTQDMYRCYWTAYKGAREMIAPDGQIINSYEEFVFPPAYKLINRSADVATASALGYRVSPNGSTTGFQDDDTTSAAYYDNGGITYSKRVGVWIRLQKSFYDTLESLGGSGAKLSTGAEIISLENTTTGVTATPQNKYPEARYLSDTASREIRTGTTVPSTISTVVALPYAEGQVNMSNVTTPGSLSLDHVTNPALENSKGHSGFLIPHPMGAKWTDTNAALGGQVADWTGNLSLNHQLVEVYDAITTSTDAVGITVSGIPGSVPFPGFFTGNLQIESDKIHIGGMTDVYLKGSEEEARTTGAITCSPHSLLDTTEVLATGIDGSTTASTGDFISPTLFSYLSNAFSLGALTKSLDNLAVVLVDPANLTPTAFRIIHNITNGVKIDGSFNDTKANIQWRLIDVSSVSLMEPLTVLQQGLDLDTVAGSSQVTAPGGFSFQEDPSTSDIYLRILESNDDRGEYKVLTKGAGVLTLESPLTVSASSVDYKVYIKQGTGMELPLVRVESVNLSGDEEGIVVPYKDPVDIISSSFTGLNDDPITDTSSHGTGTGTLNTNGTAITFTTATPINFVDAGVITYDVLRLDGQSDPIRHFYVTGFANSGGGTNNDILILDRLESSVTGAVTGLTFTLGHPAVGTGECVFLDPTYIRVDQNSVFSYQDADGNTFKFRPSPAEQATLWESAFDSSDITISNNAGVPKQLDSLTVDFFKHGITAGDKIQILSTQIQSQNLSTTSGYTLAGKSLVISVDGVKTTIVFSGTNPLTLDDIVADINRSLQDKLRAEVIETVPATSWAIRISSSNAVEILDEGSVGILITLGWTVVADRKNTNPTTLISEFTVDSMLYDSATGTTSIVLTATTTGTAGDVVFIRALREKEQRIYPGDMTELDTGLWSGKVKLTSYDPFTTDTVAADEQFTVTGHESLGYDVTVDNANYTYSMGEECFIRVTSVMLPDTAKDFSTVYALPGADVTVNYDRSQPTEDVQTYMLNEEVRVVCNNPLVRHFLPAYPTFIVEYTGNQTAVQVKDKISEFLATLYPNKPLEVFDLTTVLSKLGLNYVAFPQEAAFLAHNENREVRMVRSDDVVNLNKKFHVMGDVSRVIVTRVG